jgi:putative hemolysin
MDRFNESLLGREVAQLRRRLSVGLAGDAGERRAAQRLRWQVFADELGAKLESAEPGIDQDIFDQYCEHLVVRDGTEVVGTYRLLPPEGAKRIGLYYSETEFDLIRLRGIRSRMVEVGRSCIAPGYRSGAVIALLWSGLARYMLAHGHGYLAGCASISLADGGQAAAYLQQLDDHLAPIEYQVIPRRRVPEAKIPEKEKPSLPPLVKGYLRCGAWVCGEPAWDPEFNCADFFMLLPVARLEARYARHFFGPG